MADMTLATANKIDVDTSGPTVQRTSIAAEDITAGAPVLFDANGKFINADANGTGTVGLYGIATRTVEAGEPLTAIRRGIMSGWSNLPAYGAAVYVSNTSGALADAAGGTSIVVGYVDPVWGETLGTAADKALRVEVTSGGVSA